MKPKEFDELIRQKFDQNDFAYKSGNWDSLAEKLEGSAKKRRVIMWWWIPLAGMAASVALAMGSTSLLQHGISLPTNAKTELTHIRKSSQLAPKAASQTTIEISSHKEIAYASANNNNSKENNKQDKNKQDKNVSEWFHVRLNQVSLQTAHEQNEGFSFLAGGTNNKVKAQTKKIDVAVKEGYNTFKQEEETVKKIPTVSITLLGGYNSGGQNTGYTAGAAIRRMLSDKVYIESDVAFTSSSNSESIPNATYNPVSVGNGGGANISGARTSGARTTGTGITGARTTGSGTATINSERDQNTTSNNSNNIVWEPDVKNYNENYNIYYAQVSPAIGFKIISRVSIAVGPDFQQMLVDKRPAITDNVDRGNIQVAPGFDIGLMGKTEYALTKRIKAAVSYRRGVNNIFTLTDKYTDRDYMQFQVKYTVFNK